MDKKFSTEDWEKFTKNTLIDLLGITFSEAGSDFVILKMPVTQQLTQINGILHGGASFALAETAGSFGAFLLYCAENEQIRGVELSGNHLKSAVVGDILSANAHCINAGKTLQVWEIKITNQDEKLISFCKFTTMKIRK